MRYNITPVSKPRQTRSDKWKERPAVMRYRAFADECRKAGMKLSEQPRIIFVVPMPSSWSKKKKAEHLGQPHRAKPDLDNLIKAVLDALLDDDCGVHCVAARKIWGVEGAIVVEEMTKPPVWKSDCRWQDSEPFPADDYPCDGPPIAKAARIGQERQSELRAEVEARLLKAYRLKMAEGVLNG